MNNARRKELKEIADGLVALKARWEDIFESLQNELSDIKEGLESVRDDEQNAYDNMPESLQNGERGQASQSAIEEIESTISELENINVDWSDIESYIDTSLSSIETATES